MFKGFLVIIFTAMVVFSLIVFVYSIVGLIVGTCGAVSGSIGFGITGLLSLAGVVIFMSGRNVLLERI